VTGRRKKHKNY